MTKNLSDALNAAKKNRNVLSKHIIWESGVSKTQFYRIINGEETPSLETKKRISESLEIEPDQFDVLQNHSKLTQNKSVKFQGHKKRWLPLIFVLSVLLMGMTMLIANNFHQDNDIDTIKDTVKIVADQEDNTVFIKDVTIPDGSSVPVNTTFEKIWRVKNNGNVVWTDRYLKRMTLPSNLLCSSPAMVPIPETLPGETVDISVTFTSPHLPGSCRTDWKAADQHGNLYFPDMHGLYSIVTVVAK